MTASISSATARLVWFLALPAAAAPAAGCGGSGGAHDVDDTGADAGGGMDAGMSPPGPTLPPLPGDAGPLPDVPAFEGMFAEPAEGRVCNLLLGVECDGHEDCPGSQRCCATLETATLTYTRMACSDACDGAGQREICHPGDSCAAGEVCRTSQILPFSFISVCAMPGTALTEPTGRNVEGEVVCGDGPTCQAGAEKCCLRATVSGLSRAAQTYEPYCAPIAQECDCDLDLGGDGDDAGTDEDAGTSMDEDGGA